MVTTQDQMPAATIPGVLALLLVLGAIGAGLAGRHVAKKNAAIETWPSTTATVTGCDYIPFQSPNDSRQQQSLSTGYKYTVEGRPYDFTMNEYAGYGTGRVAPACKGREVPIYFNPADPHDSTFKRAQDTLSSTPLFIIAIGLALLSLPFWYLALRWSRKKAANLVVSL